MNAESLQHMFGLNHYVIGVNARDLSHQESLAEPQPGGNCANWVLGHIVATRGAVLSLVGEQPVWDAATTDRYKRGSKPITPQTAKPMPEILEALDRSQERLVAGLSRLKSEDLAKPAGDETVGKQLATLQFHEAYHAGQLGLLRRIAGKPGAIK
jgi:uncharacterized damage-inducible protein DinB